MKEPKPPRSEAEIAAEIEALEIIKKHVQNVFFFGFNYSEAINAQVVVLIDGLSEEEIEKRYKNATSINGTSVMDYALEAYHWMKSDTDFSKSLNILDRRSERRTKSLSDDWLKLLESIGQIEFD